MYEHECKLLYYLHERKCSVAANILFYKNLVCMYSAERSIRLFICTLQYIYVLYVCMYCMYVCMYVCV